MTAGKYAEAGDVLEAELDELTRRAEAQKGMAEMSAKFKQQGGEIYLPAQDAAE